MVSWQSLRTQLEVGWPIKECLPIGRCKLGGIALGKGSKEKGTLLGLVQLAELKDSTSQCIPTNKLGWNDQFERLEEWFEFFCCINNRIGLNRSK